MHHLLLVFALMFGHGQEPLRSTGEQGCGMDLHRHALDFDEKGHYVVNKQKGEPDIVFDGECHDEQEHACKEEADGTLNCHGRKLPKPCPMGQVSTESGSCETPKSTPENGKPKRS